MVSTNESKRTVLSGLRRESLGQSEHMAWAPCGPRLRATTDASRDGSQMTSSSTLSTPPAADAPQHGLRSAGAPARPTLHRRRPIFASRCRSHGSSQAVLRGTAEAGWAATRGSEGSGATRTRRLVRYTFAATAP
ncbi:unnamed protein product [Ixodes persulcatus]